MVTAGEVVTEGAETEACVTGIPKISGSLKVTDISAFLAGVTKS